MHLKRKRVLTQLPEDYTRVTNPERLLPLHDFALQLLRRLAGKYEVVQSDVFEMLPGIMRRFTHVRPPVTLAPSSPDGASISVAFTAFPGLIVRCGRFFNSPLPICGCDHCAETFEGEAERLQGILDPVVTGHFLEEVKLPIFGTAHARWQLGRIDMPYGLSGGGISLSRDRARELRRAGLMRFQWQPWSTRVSQLSPRAF